MTKPNLNSKWLLLSYILASIGLVIFNVAEVYEARGLKSNLDFAQQDLKSKQDIQAKAREASEGMFLIRLETIRFDEDIADFLGDRQPDGLSVDELLTNDVTTVVIPYTESNWHGIRIFTTEKEPLQVKLQVSHLIVKPRTNRVPKGGKLLGEYEFDLDIQPNVWNAFGFPVTFHNRDPIPVTSTIDGVPRIEGELPAWQGRNGSSGGSILFVGKISADAGSIWFEKKPLTKIFLRELDPKATEYLKLDVIFSKAK